MSAHGDVDMGHTVAGWTGTALALIGCTGAGAAVCAAWMPGVWLGLGLVAAAAVVTWVLHLAGWGKPGGPRPRTEWDWRTRDAGARTGHAHCLGCRAGRRAAAPAPGPVRGAGPALGPQSVEPAGQQFEAAPIGRA